MIGMIGEVLKVWRTFKRAAEVLHAEPPIAQAAKAAADVVRDDRTRNAQAFFEWIDRETAVAFTQDRAHKAYVGRFDEMTNQAMLTRVAIAVLSQGVRALAHINRNLAVIADRLDK